SRSCCTGANASKPTRRTNGCAVRLFRCAKRCRILTPAARRLAEGWAGGKMCGIRLRMFSRLKNATVWNQRLLDIRCQFKQGWRVPIHYRVDGLDCGKTDVDDISL